VKLKVTNDLGSKKNQQSIRSGIRNPVKKDRGLTRSSYRTNQAIEELKPAERKLPTDF